MPPTSQAQPSETCNSRVFLQGENLVIADTSLALQLVVVVILALFTGIVAFCAVTFEPDSNLLYFIILPVSALFWGLLITVALTGGERYILDRSSGRFTRGIHLAFGILLDTSAQMVGTVTAVSITTETKAVLVKKGGRGSVAPKPQKVCRVQLVHVPASGRDPASLELFYTTDAARASFLGQKVGQLLKVAVRESRIR